MRAGVPVTTLAIVDDDGERQAFATRADWTPLWASRNGRLEGDAALLVAALARFERPAGDGYIWIAAEAQVARALRDHARNVLDHPVEWLKASGYWACGASSIHEPIEA